jgi:hypothetical protein
MENDKGQKKLKVGQKIRFMINGEIEHGKIIGLPQNGESIAVQYGIMTRAIVKPEDVR